MYDTVRQPALELAALRVAVELAREPVFLVDACRGRIVDANPAACQALGVARRELIGRSWSGTAGRFANVTLRDLDAGRSYFVALARESIVDQSARSLLPRDVLTGLANREAFFARVLAGNDDRRPGRLGLLFIDLDGFKQVNDTWGHIAGDRVLRAVAQRLSDSVRPGDLVVRYGGDEFLVLVEAVGRRRDLDRLARRIARAVRRPILVAAQEIIVSASIGIAQRNSPVGPIDALIAEADSAMYRAKSQSRERRGGFLLSQNHCVGHYGE